jgi:hypothetical protein
MARIKIMNIEIESTDSGVKSTERLQATMPKRGDKYMWQTGYTITVESVDSSTSVVVTDAGIKTKVPTESPIGRSKLRLVKG